MENLNKSEEVWMRALCFYMVDRGNWDDQVHPPETKQPIRFADEVLAAFKERFPNTLPSR